MRDALPKKSLITVGELIVLPKIENQEGRKTGAGGGKSGRGLEDTVREGRTKGGTKV